MLVTHQLQYLKDVQLAVLMNMGRIEAQGTYNDLKQSRNHSLLCLGSEEEKEGLDENLAEEVRPKKLNVCENAMACRTVSILISRSEIDLVRIAISNSSDDYVIVVISIIRTIKLS